jgi:hypothetical protein
MLGGIDNTLFFTSFGGFFALLVLIPLLKWAFARGKSVVERPVRIGSEDEYGLLVSVAEPKNHIEGEILKQTLQDSGIRANLVQTINGPRVMVQRDEAQIAQALLRSRPTS